MNKQTQILFDALTVIKNEGDEFGNKADEALQAFVSQFPTSKVRPSR